MPVVTACEQRVCQASCSFEPAVSSLSLIRQETPIFVRLALVVAHERVAGDAPW